MNPSISELQSHYTELTDDELLQIHATSDLTENAKIAIASELNHRGLTDKDINDIKKYNEKLSKDQNQETQEAVNKDIKRTVFIWGACIILAILGYTFGFIE